MNSLRRHLFTAGVITLGLSLSCVFTSPASASNPPLNVNGKHVMYGVGVLDPTTDASANNLIYHGGLVETTPAVYLVFWGPAWKNGFKVQQQGFTYTNKTAITYLQGFFGNIGGSAWNGVQSQYCDNIEPGFSCAGQLTAEYVQNQKGVLKGTWIDPSDVPSDIVTTALAENATADPIQQEALNAAAHFGYNINATYVILTQPDTQATGYNAPGGVYCAYHAETPHTTGHGVRYAFVPYVPEQGSGCGVNSVNTKDNAYGNGYLDGYSIVAGHEYAEAVTDPDNQMSTQDGWNDVSTMENGDKCAWTGLGNITLGAHVYAVQPMWSNEAAGGQGGCAMKRGTQ